MINPWSMIKWHIRHSDYFNALSITIELIGWQRNTHDHFWAQSSRKKTFFLKFQDVYPTLERLFLVAMTKSLQLKAFLHPWCAQGDRLEERPRRRSHNYGISWLCRTCDRWLCQFSKHPQEVDVANRYRWRDSYRYYRWLREVCSTKAYI